ncbi:Pyridoxal-5'-phosphate-dependent protein beta [Desulfovibrionales bacterium]
MAISLTRDIAHTRTMCPTFTEMLDPSRIDPDLRRRAIAAKNTDPLDPVNFFNITWKDEADEVQHFVLPEALTGVAAPIVCLYGKEFPTGSHKVGATYSTLVEQLVTGAVEPGRHVTVWPSTGNYGIGGAWVGGRMGFESVVVLPAEMSTERFERIQAYGGRIIATPGGESNVKEIYDKCKELTAGNPTLVRVMNQFEALSNYRFHSYVTGGSAAELAETLMTRGIGKGRVAAFVSAMGSAGTIGAGDTLKERWPDCRIIGLEPIQCPTLYQNGYGNHDIQGIGDKHATWIHNVLNMDAIMCLDDLSCKLGLQLLVETAGQELLRSAGIMAEQATYLRSYIGISGICNILGAIKTAKYFGFNKDDLIITVCTDSIDRYHSVLARLTKEHGAMDHHEAACRLKRIFHGQGLDWIEEGTMVNRERWHNIKYYTWVEQQGKSITELDAQRSQAWWQEQRSLVTETDRRIATWRQM